MPIGDDILSLCHLEACERQRLALLDLLELSNPRRPLDLEALDRAEARVLFETRRRKRIYQAMIERAQHRLGARA